jgi:hypothetical protein
MEVSGQLHAPAALRPGKVSGSHCIGGWMGPRAGLDVTEKKINLLPLTGIEPRPLGCLACSLVAIPTELSRLPYSMFSGELFILDGSDNIIYVHGKLTIVLSHQEVEKEVIPLISYVEKIE